MLSFLILYVRNIINTIVYYIFYKYTQPTIITTANQAHEILESPEYTRHKPNAWLIDTLSIVNPFTISSDAFRLQFKNKVITMLSHWNNELKYEELISITRKRIDYHLPVLQSKDGEVCLSKLVKQVTLDSFLSAILDVHATDDLLTELPDLIIHLWKDRNDKAAQHRLQELFSSNQENFSRSEVWEKIQTILSNHSETISKIATNDFNEKISNPLNIIVPGWETMWRVVFYSLLELLRHRELLTELRSQLNDPTKSYRDCVLLEWVLKETLRLYPPTKNIYRTNINTGEDVCISVQQIHRNTNAWGLDALCFRPDRFEEKLTPEQTKHYLPFSISCPARHGFTYSFAGAIVAEILDHFPNFMISEGASLPSTDSLFSLARNSYNDLLIIL